MITEQTYGVGTKDDRMKPWKTLRMAFQHEGKNVTLHSTGQAWVTRLSDGVLVLYHDGKCHFGCMK